MKKNSESSLFLVLPDNMIDAVWLHKYNSWTAELGGGVGGWRGAAAPQFEAKIKYIFLENMPQTPIEAPISGTLFKFPLPRLPPKTFVPSPLA